MQMLALSRRPSEPTAAETSAEACVSMLELCAAVGFASIPGWTKEQLQQFQSEDKVIGPVLQEVKGPRPIFTGRWRRQPALRAFWRVWNQLAVENGLLVRRVRQSPMSGGQAKSLPVIPEALVTSCLECLHGKTGHLGLEKTIGLVKERVWWPGYTRDVDTWTIAHCSTCAKRKSLLSSQR